MEKGGERAEPQGGGWSQDWPGAGRGGVAASVPFRSESSVAMCAFEAGVGDMGTVR